MYTKLEYNCLFRAFSFGGYAYSIISHYCAERWSDKLQKKKSVRKSYMSQKKTEITVDLCGRKIDDRGVERC